MKFVGVIVLFIAGVTNTLAQSTASTAAGQPYYLPSASSALTNKPLDPGTYISPIDYAMRVNSFIPYKDKFKNHEFANGYLFFSSGRRSPIMKLNFNLFLGAMHFIDKKGDTLMLYASPDLKYVVTDEHLFFHDLARGYFEICGGKNDKVKLGKQKIFNQSEVEALTSDKSYSENYSTETALSIEYVPHDPKRPKQKILFLKEDQFFLIDEHEKLEPATKKGFLKIFMNHDNEIKHFLKQQAKEQKPISFNSEQDLARLLTFCNSISPLN